MNTFKKFDVEAKVMGQTCEISGKFINGKASTGKFRILGDSGACLSAISNSFLLALSKEGFDYRIRKTERPTPSSASNHTLTVMGDAILNVELNGPKGTLRIMNIRFTILFQLAVYVSL